MSAIVGIYNLEGHSVDRAVIEQMGDDSWLTAAGWWLVFGARVVWA
jgi:hypothetical protein